MDFKTYVENLSIAKVFKEKILDEDFIKRNPAYYQNYPSLFAKPFLVEHDVIGLLDIAGFLYYQSTLFTDSLIDQQDLSNFPLITICQEESIKILTHIFGLKSEFWKLWNGRKLEYLSAIELEKNLLKKANISIREYEMLSDYKSAFGKVAIDCLFSIDSSNLKNYNHLLLSHKYFSVAFQLNDDIQDFKNDLINNQFNYAVYLLKSENIKITDPILLEKYLYIKGISKQIYLLGIKYCNKALATVKSIDVPNWKEVLNDTIKAFKRSIFEIDNYIEILTSEIYQSNEYALDNNLNNCTTRAIQYIKSKQKDDGSWREYVNQGGISSTWATAFIVSKVSENQTLRNSFGQEISEAIAFLKKNQVNNLWGYNTTWIADADSTNFAFLSQILNNIEINPMLFEQWLEFQNKDNGFSTYSNAFNLLQSLNDKNISNVDGWINSHNCVSAVSLYLLALLSNEKESFVRAKKYFEEDFQSRTKSYWWTSDIYTHYYLAKTYSLNNDIERLSFIIEQIKSFQNDDGSFSDSYGKNLFYTGLALEILLLSINSDLEINKTLNYLLNEQYEDGSWENSNALQVPNSQDKIPSSNAFPIATFGMNVRAKEFNRLFTTAAILQSITIYEQKYDSKAFS